MANITFGVNLIPKTNNTYTLGNSDNKWNIYANTINGYVLNGYAECSTAADTAEKTASIPNFELSTNATIFIKFTYANAAATPTLSINNGTAVPIYLNNSNKSPWDANEVVQLLYDGTQWNIVGYNETKILNAPTSNGTYILQCVVSNGMPTYSWVPITFGSDL